MTERQEVRAYLAGLRAALGPVELGEREEIVREIEAHIEDSLHEPGATPAVVLERLGTAEALAAQYREGLLIRRASRSHSPVTLLRGALRLATKGVFGVLVFFAGIFGYLMGGGMVLAGVLKPIFPHNAGIWMTKTHVVSAGVLTPAPPPPAHEVAGIWFTPIMLVLGALLLLATTAVIRSALRTSQRWQAYLGH